MAYNSTGVDPEPRADGPWVRFRNRSRKAFSAGVRVGVIATLGLACATLVQSGLRAHEQNQALWAKAEMFAAEGRRLEEKRALLAAEAYALDRDPYYIERLLREDWHRRREGDVILERTRP